MTIKCGIDYSMSCPAIVIYDDSKPLTFENIKIFAMHGTKCRTGSFGSITVDLLPKKYSSNEERYTLIATWAINILKANNVKHINLEGYSMGSTVGLLFNIAENTSVLKQMLYEAGITYTACPPKQVKKQFTGNGNAGKPDMVNKIDEILGIDLSKTLAVVDFDSPSHDIADAFANMLFIEPQEEPKKKKGKTKK